LGRGEGTAPAGAGEGAAPAGGGDSAAPAGVGADDEVDPDGEDEVEVEVEVEVEDVEVVWTIPPANSLAIGTFGEAGFVPFSVFGATQLWIETVVVDVMVATEGVLRRSNTFRIDPVYSPVLCRGRRLGSDASG